MNKLSKREQVLLYILLLFLIFAAGLFLLVKPAIQRVNTLEGTLSDKQMEQVLRRSAIAASTDSETAIETYRAKLEAGYADFYEPKTNEDIDRLVTGLLTKHHFSPVSLAVPGTAQSPIEAYRADDEESGGTAVPAEGLVCSVTATAEGQMADLVSLAEEVRRLPQMALTGFSQAAGNNLYTITFDLYFFEQLD